MQQLTDVNCCSLIAMAERSCFPSLNRFNRGCHFGKANFRSAATATISCVKSSKVSDQWLHFWQYEMASEAASCQLGLL